MEEEKTILQYLKQQKDKTARGTFFFSSKLLAVAVNISLYKTKKVLTSLRKRGIVKWECDYDDTDYCKCFNENQNHCECPEENPLDRVRWYWTFN